MKLVLSKGFKAYILTQYQLPSDKFAEFILKKNYFKNKVLLVLIKQR